MEIWHIVGKNNSCWIGRERPNYEDMKKPEFERLAVRLKNELLQMVYIGRVQDERNILKSLV